MKSHIATFIGALTLGALLMHAAQERPVTGLLPAADAGHLCMAEAIRKNTGAKTIVTRAQGWEGPNDSGWLCEAHTLSVIHEQAPNEGELELSVKGVERFTLFHSQELVSVDLDEAGFEAAFSFINDR